MIKLSILSVILCIGLKTTNSEQIKCSLLEIKNDKSTKVYCYNAYAEDIDFYDDKKSIISELELSRSNFQYIYADMFEGFTNLVNLTIVDSEIEDIEENALSQMKNLEVLEISLSELQSLDARFFGNLTKLEQLILNDNFIREIGPDTFSNLTNLKELQLRNNELEEIFVDTFEGLTNVEVIDLSGNPIEFIEKSSFDTCSSLKKLILEQSSEFYVLDIISSDFEIVFVTSESKSQPRMKMVISQDIRLTHPIIALSIIITLIGVIVFLLVATVFISFMLRRYRLINESCSKFTGPVAGG